MVNRDVLYKFAFVDGVSRVFYAWEVIEEERVRVYVQSAFLIPNIEKTTAGGALIGERRRRIAESGCDQGQRA